MLGCLLVESFLYCFIGSGLSVLYTLLSLFELLLEIFQLLLFFGELFLGIGILFDGDIDGTGFKLFDLLLQLTYLLGKSLSLLCF